jgi:hypothetical protein
MDVHLSNIPGKLKTVHWGEMWLDISLYLLFLTFFLGPFIDSPSLRLLLTSLVFSLLMIAGVVSMSHKASIRFAAGLVAGIAILLRWLTHFVPTPTIVTLGSIAVIAFLIMLIVVTLAKVFGKGRVTIHRIKGAIAVYMLFGLTWSILYGFLDQVLPHAFNLPPVGYDFSPERQESLTFFSFVTLTTVGYGDIIPTHDITRMLAIMEALVGQLYPATLLARLVSLEIVHRGEQSEEAQ